MQPMKDEWIFIRVWFSESQEVTNLIEEILKLVIDKAIWTILSLYKIDWKFNCRAKT